jgi:predicted transcriptional regulator
MSAATITLRTNSKLITAINKLAESMDRSRNWVIESALQDYVELQSWQVEGIEEAIRSLDKGEGIPDEEVMARFEKKKLSKIKSNKHKSK